MGLPDGFRWGTAAASTQTEGAAPASDWWLWERAGRVPSSGGGNDFATRYAEDLQLFASSNLRHHRLTLEWARLEPSPGRHDAAAVEHYADVLAAARQAGVAPWACLHDRSVPGWFLDEGGFADDRARARFWDRHVTFVAETFGDEVAGWVPSHDPTGYATAAYLAGTHPPGLRSGERFARTVRGMVLAWRDAWRELRGGPPVTTSLQLPPIFAADSTRAARDAAGDVERMLWGVWVSALRDGIVDVPGLAEEQAQDLAGSGDFVGLAYHHAVAVAPDLSFRPYPHDARTDPLGAAPWAEGLGIALRQLAEELPSRPLLVTAHGIGTPDDTWRVEELRASLAALEAAVDDGVPVQGFFHWTGVDGYEWRAGFDVPYGLFDRDREPKASAHLLAEAAAAT